MPRSSYCVSLLLVLALAACSRPDPAASGRVAAKVNGTDISVQRFQMLFTRASAQSAQKPAPKLFMDALIDRELLAQKALDLKLDRDTGVAIALADAKANVLAQAYVEQAIGSTPEDSAAVTAFYDENPQLFKE